MPSRLFWACATTYPYLDSTFCGIAERLSCAGLIVKIHKEDGRTTFSSTEFGQHTINPTTLCGEYPHGSLTPLAAMLLIGGYTRPEPAVLLAHADGSPLARPALRATLEPHIQPLDRCQQTKVCAIAGLLSMAEITTICRDEFANQHGRKRRVTF